MDNLREFTVRILKHVAKDNDAVERKVVSIMGGQVIETLADKAIKAYEEGVRNTIDAYSEFNLSDDEIAKRVSEKFNIPEDTIKEKYLKDK